MTSQMCDKSWYLAQTKPNCWKIANRNLRRQGFETFLPVEEVTRRAAAKFIKSTKPLFPGYLFLAFNSSSNCWRSVNSTYGVSKIVSFGSTPALIPADLVKAIKLRCDQDGLLLPPKVLRLGDAVRLTAGPFADFVGFVESVSPEQRVWVLIEILGGPNRISVDADQLQMK